MCLLSVVSICGGSAIGLYLKVCWLLFVVTYLFNAATVAAAVAAAALADIGDVTLSLVSFSSL